MRGRNTSFRYRAGGQGCGTGARAAGKARSSPRRMTKLAVEKSGLIKELLKAEMQNRETRQTQSRLGKNLTSGRTKRIRMQTLGMDKIWNDALGSRDEESRTGTRSGMGEYLFWEQRLPFSPSVSCLSRVGVVLLARMLLTLSTPPIWWWAKLPLSQHRVRPNILFCHAFLPQALFPSFSSCFVTFSHSSSSQPTSSSGSSSVHPF